MPRIKSRDRSPVRRRVTRAIAAASACCRAANSFVLHAAPVALDRKILRCNPLRLRNPGSGSITGASMSCNKGSGLANRGCVQGHMDHGFAKHDHGVQAHRSTMCLHIDLRFDEQVLSFAKLASMHGHTAGLVACTSTTVCPCMQVLFGKRVVLLVKHGAQVAQSARAVVLARAVLHAHRREVTQTGGPVRLMSAVVSEPPRGARAGRGAVGDGLFGVRCSCGRSLVSFMAGDQDPLHERQ